MRRKFLMTVAILFMLGLFIGGFSGVAFADDGIYRSLLKAGGLIGALLGIIGISLAGYVSGKSYDSYTGWERYTHGAGMFFNRKPFHKDRPTYEVTEKTLRVKWIDSILHRNWDLKIQRLRPYYFWIATKVKVRMVGNYRWAVNTSRKVVYYERESPNGWDRFLQKDMIVNVSGDPKNPTVFSVKLPELTLGIQ
ncbi:MAG: hypothetical protein PVH99_13280 [Desulfobacteraceae bacterium]|jgi:hypothetical protein